MPFEMDSTISIHAPREGGDFKDGLPAIFWRFQSTPPARGATQVVGLLAPGMDISIHAPREGGDNPGLTIRGVLLTFQSTPPARGATPERIRLETLLGEFQSTPPARGATFFSAQRTTCCSISIHAPREGGRLCVTLDILRPLGFQSTPPARGATGLWCEDWCSQNISIHAPREGGD